MYLLNHTRPEAGDGMTERALSQLHATDSKLYKFLQLYVCVFVTVAPPTSFKTFAATKIDLLNHTRPETGDGMTEHAQSVPTSYKRQTERALQASATVLF